MSKRHRDALPGSEGGEGIHVVMRWPAGTEATRLAMTLDAADLGGVFMQTGTPNTFYVARAVGTGADKWQFLGSGAGGGALTPTAIQTSGIYNASAGEMVLVSTATGPAEVTVNFPASPVDGDFIGIMAVDLEPDPSALRDIVITGGTIVTGWQEQRIRCAFGIFVWRFSSVVSGWLLYQSDRDALKLIAAPRGQLQTTDATETTLFSFALPNIGVLYKAAFDIAAAIASLTAGSVADFHLRLQILRAGSGVVTIENSTPLVSAIPGPLAGIVVAADVSGASVRVRVTGLPATTIRWQIKGEATSLVG